MPIYRYRCKTCEAEFFKIHSYKQKLVLLESECAECGEKEIFEQISPSSFRLKGGGWEKDGYK
ncbi:MAG: zinc ribbon domain-containing protein [Candidatus Peribacter sp.]|jgi:putative FmdB family regulatory protein|nr:zinc ribbon domain-containing protein [Candidatus Peribacter sp.]